MNQQESRIGKHSMELERKTASLYVRSTGFRQGTDGVAWGPGIRDYFILIHVLSGRGVYICGQRRYELKSGDTFLVMPGIKIHYFADERDPWECTWVGFDGLEAGELIRRTTFSALDPVLYRREESEELGSLIQRIHDSSGTALEDRLVMTAHLYQLAAFLVRSLKVTVADTQDDRDCAQMAAEYIVAHYEEPITVEGLATYTAVSHSSLYRRFMKRFQMSPKRFLLEYRMDRACQLLTSTDLSVQDISVSVGFEDPFYFSRAFKEITGLSPRQYANLRKRQSAQQSEMSDN